MKTKSLILLFVSALMITKGFSIPSLINYQGRLTDNNGAAVANSQLNVSVSIYDVLSGGDALHTENLQNVETDENGVYAFQFGDGMQSILEDNESLWLEITIEGDTLSPRQQLLAVPYASVAKSLEDGATLGNISLTGDLGARRVNVDQTLTVDGMSDLQEVYASRLNVYGEINGSGAHVDFSNASSIRVPAPSNQGDASNKSYVDSLTTANAASIAANSTSITTNTSNISTNTSNISTNTSNISTNTSNISTNTSNISTNTSNISANTTAIAAETTAREAENALRSEKEPVRFVYDTNQSIYGFAPYIDLNSRILLVGQTNPNQNGIYTWLGTIFEGGPNRTLVRTQDFDEASEMQAGAFVFATSGESSGKGYVLTQTVTDINNSSINFKRFTYDQESDAFDAATLSSKAPVQYVYEYERSFSTTNYDGADYSFYNDYIQSYSAGDRILLIGQSDAEENGIYEVIGNIYGYTYITRASDLDEQNEFFGGIFVFVEKGPLAGQGYVLGALHDNFQLDAAYNWDGDHDLNFSRFTVDTTQNVEFENRVTVGELNVSGHGGSVNFNGDSNRIDGNLDVNGYRADFESVQELLVPTPDQANEATNKAYVDNADSVLQGIIDQNESDADTAITANTSAITALQTDVDQNEADADTSIASINSSIFDNETNIANNSVNISNNSSDIAANTSAIAAETTARTSAIATLQADVDQNEADADAEIATLQADIDDEIANRSYQDAALQVNVSQNEADIASLRLSDDSKAPVQYVEETDIYFYPSLNYGDYQVSKTFNTYEQGERILLVGQDEAKENGIYEIMHREPHYIWLSRAQDLNWQNEFFGGIFVFVEKGPLAGQGYVLGALHDNFTLDGVDNSNGYHDLNFSRFTIDRTQDVEFENRVTARELRVMGPGGTIIFDGNINSISGNLYVNGNTADFESVQQVRVPTPDQANEATNKAYVDSAVIPLGALVAWNSNIPLPDGWANSGLPGPMVDYIWIVKY